MAEGNAISPTIERNYDVTYQPASDASDYYHKTPVLPKSHVVIVYSQKDEVPSPGEPVPKNVCWLCSQIVSPVY